MEDYKLFLYKRELIGKEHIINLLKNDLESLHRTLERTKDDILIQIFLHKINMKELEIKIQELDKQMFKRDSGF